MMSKAIPTMHGIHFCRCLVPQQLRKSHQVVFSAQQIRLPVASSLRARPRSDVVAWAAATATFALLAITDKHMVCCETLALHTSALSLRGQNTGKQPQHANDFAGGSADGVEERTLSVCGKDRRGRPTLVARPSFHVAQTKQESIEAVADCMEIVRNSINMLPPGESQVLVLYDLGGAGYRNLDMTFSRKLLDSLVQEFPYTLDKVLVINGHWSMAAAWRAVQVLLHPETQRRVAFYGKDYRERLLDFLDANHPYLRYLKAVQKH
jgi:hypothetical protein